MSTQETNDKVENTSNGDSNTRYTKTVQFVGYTGVDADVPKREAMRMIAPDVDWDAKKVSEYDKYLMHAKGWNKRIGEDEFERLAEMDTGDVHVTHYVKESESWQNGTYQIRDPVRGHVRDALPDDVNGGFSRSYGFQDWSADNDATISFGRPSFTTMGMLKHPSEITADEMWEDEEAEQWVVTLTVEAEDVTASQLKWVNKSIFEKVPEIMAGHDHIRRVRFTDCREERSKEGVCYGV